MGMIKNSWKFRHFQISLMTVNLLGFKTIVYSNLEQFEFDGLCDSMQNSIYSFSGNAANEYHKKFIAKLAIDIFPKKAQLIVIDML